MRSSRVTYIAESYKAAALEHLASAQYLHEQDKFYLAHYFSGLAVECMLRAYLRLITDEFESRHDLRKLAAEAKFFDIVPDELQEEFGAKFSELNLRWRSNQRYSTEKQLWSYLSSVRADFKQRGNPYKNHSRTLLNLALDVINLGARKWQRSQQSQTPSSTP